jgi:hypothetical protein
MCHFQHYLIAFLQRCLIASGWCGPRIEWRNRLAAVPDFERGNCIRHIMIANRPPSDVDCETGCVTA